MYLMKYRTNIKCSRSDQSSVWTKKQPRMGNQLPHVLAVKDNERYTTTGSGTRPTIEECSKAYFPARNQKGTEATNGMMRLLSLRHLSFWTWSTQQGVVNHWLCRQIDNKFPLIFSSMWILLVFIYFINQSCNLGKLTFVNASFWVKMAAVHRLCRLFNLDL